MKNTKTYLTDNKERIFYQIGENIKLIRRSKKLSTNQVAERANISRPTLWKIEKGSSSVAIGSYFQVLFVLGLNIYIDNKTDDILNKNRHTTEMSIRRRVQKKINLKTLARIKVL